MRLLIFLAVLMLAGCGLGTAPTATSNDLEGSWKLLTMSKEPLEHRQVAESDLQHGTLNFKADNTFEGEVVYPGRPELDVKVSGIYSLENNVVTIVNHSNNSSTRSTIAFEKDMLVMTPVDPAGLISYLKRVK